MSISVDSNSYISAKANQTSTVAKSKQLENALNHVSESTDEELMSVCKNFESYFIEQVYKEMKKTVKSENEDNQYMQYFGEMLTQQYADDSTEGEGLGIAQMLYESMKRN